MRIFIGDTSRTAMEALGIKSFPFTEVELKSKFRILIHKYHEDKGGSKEKAQKIIAAYKHLKNLASDEIKKDIIYQDSLKNRPKVRPFNPVIPEEAIMKGG